MTDDDLMERGVCDAAVWWVAARVCAGRRCGDELGARGDAPSRLVARVIQSTYGAVAFAPCSFAVACSMRTWSRFSSSLFIFFAGQLLSDVEQFSAHSINFVVFFDKFSKTPEIKNKKIITLDFDAL